MEDGGECSGDGEGDGGGDGKDDGGGDGKGDGGGDGKGDGGGDSSGGVEDNGDGDSRGDNNGAIAGGVTGPLKRAALASQSKHAVRLHGVSTDPSRKVGERLWSATSRALARARKKACWVLAGGEVTM